MRSAARRMAPKVSALLVPAALLMLAACSSGPGGGDPPDEPPPAGADTTAPSVPAGVTVTALSATQLQITWTASTDTGSGVAGYRVFREGGATPIATVNTTSHTDSGLIASTSYSYTVQAFDSATPPNVSAQSGLASGTTLTAPAVDTTPPSVPANVTATAQSSTQIRVSWSPSTDASGISGYRVYRDGTATPVATVQTTNYTDVGLTVATQYSYTVAAVDGATPANVSAQSAAATATTGSTPPTGGLDSRPSNTSCLAGDAPSGNVALAVQRVFPSLPNFSQPIAMLQEPGNAARWYVVEKTGAVRRFENTANVSSSTVFINLASRLNSDPSSSNDERGLLGMAFHPDFPTDPRVFLFYTGTDATLGLVDRVSQFELAANGTTLDPASELELLDVDDPAGNHNGGHIAFGPDGMLYIGIGDGGSGNDPFGTIGNAQNLRTLLGKMLRIDVSASNATTTYTIPAGNPFAANPRCNVSGTSSTANCPEIYAYGLRNPWRWSFDRVSGELWLADVGQGELEEVDRIVLGGNYGWRCREGDQATGLACGPNPSPIDPVAQYGRNSGFSTTGGYVYRGSAISSLFGRYVFADFGTGNLWNIPRDTAPTLTVTSATALDTNLSVASFAEDVAGELYIVHLGGTLHRLVQGTGGGRQIPTLLSDTGCVNDADPKLPASGLIPYAPNAPFFSDNAVKTRWLALPNGQRIAVGTDDDFDFPNGSVLVKNFSLGATLVETRLFMRHNNGNWAGYTYEWNAAGTEATRVVGGKTVTVAGQTWEFPSEAQCLQCHTDAAGRTLGLEIGQLNGDFGYPTGRTANQLTTLNAIDVLTPALTETPDQLPAIPDPFGDAALGSRARAWLHTNCANCHQPGGGAQSSMDLRYTTALSATNACDVAPTLGDLGITPNPRLIAPGSAARSVVVARVDRTGTDAMPPLSRHQIDTQGVQLLTQWINGLASCN